MQTPSRRAFTLYELLIILAVLGFLFAMLLPAIAKVRAAASRATSQNNLKQIGLACHNYHDTNGAMPPGRDKNGYSAHAYLLPYIEQDNLYRLIDFKKPVTDEANAMVRQMHIKVFLSPRDPQMAVRPNVGANNYVFSAGAKYAVKGNDGMFPGDERINLAKVTDGTSNTIMTGETLKGDGQRNAVTVQRQHVALKVDKLDGLKEESGVQDFQNNRNISGNRCASWMDGRFLQTSFTATRRMNDARPDVDCGGAGGLSALRSMDDIANVLFGDGSVRAISNRIEFKTWQHLATRNGGEVVQGEF